MAVEASVDWTELERRFPTGYDPDEREERFRMFDDMYTGAATAKNKSVSLQDVTNGIQSRLSVTVAFGEAPRQLVNGIDIDQPIKLAYAAARNLTPKKRKQSKKAASKAKVDKTEFHALLCAFKAYLKLMELFQKLESGVKDNDLLSLPECQAGAKLLEKWGITEALITAEYEKFGVMKYKDFADWAIETSNVLDLSLDNDDNVEVQKELAADQVRDLAGVVNENAADAKEQNRQMLTEFFDRYDTDRSGRMKESEFAVLMAQLDPDITAEKVTVLFKAADVSGDGYLDYGEFLEWLL